jgi:nitrite reductase/ring-hydroxylating ferredoxin subunit
MISWRQDARSLVVLVIAAALFMVVIYWFAFREASPGPGWIRVGPVVDVQRQRVTKVDDNAYVVSYGDFPLYAFAASYDEGIHEAVYYCPSSGWFFNEPHATQFDITGKYKLGPAPSSTLPRVAVTVLDGNVWVDPAQLVPGLVPGAETILQRPEGPICQNVQQAI